MKKNLIVFICMMIFPLLSFAQYDKMLDELEDAEQETLNGKLVLRFFNAETGAAVDGATISVERVGAYISNLQGMALMDTVPDGNYIFRFTKEGFIPAVYEFEVSAGTIFYNRFSVCPVVEFGALRVVMEWAKRPSDLDAHLIKEGDYHVSYRDKLQTNDGSAKLDHDDQDGFGPETITIKNIDNNAVYTYFIKDYTNQRSSRSNDLSKSKAIVRIYGNNQLLNTFKIPKDQKGTTWMVFEIKNGKVNPLNTVGNQY